MPAVIPGGDLGLTPQDDAASVATGYGLTMTGLEPPHERPEDTISVLIADDQALVRGGFRSILDGQTGIRWSARPAMDATPSTSPAVDSPTWC